MLERIDEQGRLLATQGGAHKVEFLRTTLLKYLERGPESFPEFFPLFAAFLDFSEEEQLRLRQAHQRNSAGFLDGYFGSAAPLIDEHHATTAPPPSQTPSRCLATSNDPLRLLRWPWEMATGGQPTTLWPRRAFLPRTAWKLWKLRRERR